MLSRNRDRRKRAGADRARDGRGHPVDVTDYVVVPFDRNEEAT
jgi:hypothetical protein